MTRILSWLNLRFLKDRTKWITFLILAICDMMIGGGITRRGDLNYDIMLLNVAYATKFETIEEFKSWFDLWQFQRLMGAFGQLCLFPIVAYGFPKVSDPEIRIPVSNGYKRSQVWWSSLIRYVEQICILSIGCVVLTVAASRIQLAGAASASYYVRCVLLHLWRDLGFSGVALCLAILPRQRTAGICLSFGTMLVLAVAGSKKLFSEMPIRVLLGDLNAQDSMWMWQVHSTPPVGELILLLSFPIVAYGLCSIIGRFRYQADLQ